MSRQLSESAVVNALADQVCERLTRKIIAVLQEMKSELLSGDDSCLRNSWDEICVQVQFEASFSWDAYDDTVKGFLEAEVAGLAPHEREAIWLQTPEADDWSCEDESRTPYPVLNDDIVQHLLCKVYSEAANWSNPRIREYLERSSLSD